MIIGMLGAVLCVVQAEAAFLGLFGDAATQVAAKNGTIILDVAPLAKLQARRYHYQEDGKIIKFFVVRDGQGTVRAAVDACEVCWKEGKGYMLKDGAMLCVNCGRRFPLDRIGLVAGGCNPHPFRFTVENDSVLIAAQELVLQGTKYFPENR
jgi:uncharacterized membrane protein